MKPHQELDITVVKGSSEAQQNSQAGLGQAGLGEAGVETSSGSVPDITCTQLKDGSLPEHTATAIQNGVSSFVASAMRSRLPLAVEGYSLIKVLGKGGEGEVWEAERSATGERVAIKIFNRHDLIDDQDKVDDQRALADHLSQFTKDDGTPFVKISDLGKANDGRPYMTMNLLDGDRGWKTMITTAFDVEKAGVKATLKVPLETYLSMFADTARAGWFLSGVLNRIHDIGLIHRDIKPDNLSFGSSGDIRDAVLLDTGILARWRERPIDDSQMSTEFKKFHTKIPLASSEYISGTRTFMPPEAFNGESGPWTDQYAFGLSLYEMFTGINPRASEPGNAAMVIPPLRESLPTELHEKLKDPTFTIFGMPGAWVVDRLTTILDKATRAEYSQRYESMNDFAAELHAIIGNDEAVKKAMA